MNTGLAHRTPAVNARCIVPLSAYGLVLCTGPARTYPPWFTLRLFFGLAGTASFGEARCAVALSSFDAMVYSFGLPLPYSRQ